jgi:hypothetical protein
MLEECALAVRQARTKFNVMTLCQVHPAQPNEQDTENSFIIKAKRIDEVVKSDVLLLKVDVEGIY